MLVKIHLYTFIKTIKDVCNCVRKRFQYAGIFGSYHNRNTQYVYCCKVGALMCGCVLLQVEYSGDYETFSMARFGQKFVTEVANPRSILHWYRQRKSVSQSESMTPLLLGQSVMCRKHGNLHIDRNSQLHIFSLPREKRWQSRARHSPSRRDLIRWRA